MDKSLKTIQKTSMGQVALSVAQLKLSGLFMFSVVSLLVYSSR